MTNGSVTTARYGRATIALHWVMLLLLAAVFATIEMRVLFERGSETREFVKSLHFMLGLSVLVFVAVRIAAMYTGSTSKCRFRIACSTQSG